jgi:hypothetical protein
VLSLALTGKEPLLRLVDLPIVSQVIESCIGKYRVTILLAFSSPNV